MTALARVAGRSPLVVWRIAKADHAAPSGEGARLYGGRWNHPGTRVVYTSGTLSLAALEYFVHLDTDLAPEGLVSVRLVIPGDLEPRAVAIEDLPRDWRAYPTPEALQDLGTRWIRSGDDAVLSVPSAIVPEERNVLLNPEHPDFEKVEVGTSRPFDFDPRMWK